MPFTTTKMRAIVILDYNFDTFEDAAEQYHKLKNHIDEFVKANDKVLFSDIEMRERRGDRHTPLKEIKLARYG